MKTMSARVAKGYTVVEAMSLLRVRQRRTMYGYLEGVRIRGVAVRLEHVKLPSGKVLITSEALDGFIAACDRAHRGIGEVARGSMSIDVIDAGAGTPGRSQITTESRYPDRRRRPA